MQLIYLWISDYKNIKNQGFNFGYELRFNYDLNKNELSYEINPDYIENFFSINKTINIDSNNSAYIIDNVTGIIGQNGAGKSSIVEFIINNMPWASKSFPNDSIIVYKVKDEIQLWYSSGVKISNLNQLSKEFKINYRNELIYYEDPERYEENLKVIPKLKYEYGMPDAFDTLFIYYTHIFNSRDSSKVTTGNVIDLSTDSLLQQCKDVIQSNRKQEKNSIKSNNRMFELYLGKNNMDQFNLYNNNEIYKQLDFISKYKKVNSYIPFKLPKYIEIDFVYIEDKIDEIKEIKSTLQNEILKAIAEFIINFDDLICKMHKNSDFDIKNIKYKFLRCIVINYLFEFFYDNSLRYLTMGSWEANLFNVNGWDNSNIENRIIDFFENLTKINSLIEYDQARKTQKFIKYIINGLSGIDQNKGPVDFAYLNMIIHDKLIINTDEDKYFDIKEFFELYRSSYSIYPTLVFRWTGLSSGELALLTMYSRFYSALEDKRNFYNYPEAKNKDIVILVDEADSSLHPQWQKSIIYNFILFLNDLKLDTKVQIIITSNSPFIASDIPSYNIIFLRKEDETGNCIVEDSIDNMKQTFAANIHTLLSNSFFLDDGLIGDFAKCKINEIVDIINQRNIDLDELTQVKKMINLIGEPIIKNKLNSMLKAKMSNSDKG